MVQALLYIARSRQCVILQLRQLVIGKTSGAVRHEKKRTDGATARALRKTSRKALSLSTYVLVETLTRVGNTSLLLIQV